MVKPCNDPFQPQTLWVLGKKALWAVQMKAPMQVKTHLSLQLSFGCVLLTLATRDAAVMYWSWTSIYIGTATIFIFCTMKTKPLVFFSLYFQGFLCLVFHLEDFTSLSSDTPWCSELCSHHPWCCWSVLCSTQPPLAQWWDSQKLPSPFPSIAHYSKVS